MKSIVKYFVFTVLGISAMSCVKTMDFRPSRPTYEGSPDGVSSQSKVFVEFFPCGEDSSVVNLYAAHPTQMLIENPNLSSLVDNPAACLEIKVDDVPVPALNHSKSVAYVHRRFVPGETVSVYVNLGFGCKASSQTVIPPAVNDVRVVREGGEVVLDYFAEEYPEYMGVLVDYKLAEPVFGAELFFPVSANTVELGIGHVYYWKDSEAKNLGSGWHQVRFKLLSRAVHDAEEGAEFRCRICGLNEDMYRYMQTQQSMDNNYGKFGLTPAVFNWTNVQGGFGIVAGMSILSTGWFHLETTE